MDGCPRQSSGINDSAWLFGAQRQGACIGEQEEEGMQLLPRARGLCLFSTFLALSPSQLGFPHRRNARLASYPAF